MWSLGVGRLAFGWAFAVVGCEGAAHDVRVPKPPLQSVETLGRTLRITLRRDFSLQRAFESGILDGIKDHPPLDELRQRLGEPTSRWTDQYGEVWYRFKTASGEVEAGRESEESNGPRTATWYVYALPKKPIADLVIPEIAGELVRHPASSNVIVGSSDGSEAVSCELSGGGKAKCVWFSAAKEKARGL